MKIFDPEGILSEKISEKDKKEFHSKFIENKSVFGVDIYRYSDYPENIQVYVPVLFNTIYYLTALGCIKNEGFFFNNYAIDYEGFKEKFISTGDGGFQIFDNPIQSIIFGAYFELNVRRFNSGSFVSIQNKNLHDIIGRIDLRYCITFDKVYNYDANFYGAGIINNARILAKDNLNRLLIDNWTLKWIEQQANTIENLVVAKKADFLKMPAFKTFDKKSDSKIFNDSDESTGAKSIDVQKIGSIRSKNTQLDIYNLKIQFLFNFNGTKPVFEREFKSFLYTIGNLNTQGIQ